VWKSVCAVTLKKKERGQQNSQSLPTATNLSCFEGENLVWLSCKF